jgi:hypothetical protein
MDIMNQLAQARPGSLDPGPDADRRARDLAMAMATPRAGGVTVRPGATGRAGVRRPAHPARMIAIGTGIAVVAGTAGAVVALNGTAAPAARPQPSAAHAGTAVAGSGELKQAILTAVNGVWGDVFNVKITEIYAGKMSKYDGVTENWSYPIRPQAGQLVHMRSVTVPSNPDDKSDTEYIYTEPAGAKAALPTKTEVIFVQYGNRTWSDTYAGIATQSAAASLQELHQTIATGDFTVVGKTVIDGQTVLELTDHYKVDGEAGEQTVWVDPTTYLPVRTLSDDAGNTNQVDYQFLSPTPANMAKLQPIIPPGFTKTPTIQK